MHDRLVFCLSRSDRHRAAEEAVCGVDRLRNARQTSRGRSDDLLIPVLFVLSLLIIHERSKVPGVQRPRLPA
jgi:hypothetical protein